MRKEIRKLLDQDIAKNKASKSAKEDVPLKEDESQSKKKFTHSAEAKVLIGIASTERQAGVPKIVLLGPEKYKTYIQHRKESYAKFAERRLETYRATIDKRWEEHPPTSRSDTRYERWRQFCLARDNNACCICGIKEEDVPKGRSDKDSHLNVHHIRLWRNHEELRFDTNNGITLCPKCHKREHKLMKQGKTSILVDHAGRPNIIPEIDIEDKRIFSTEHRKNMSIAASSEDLMAADFKKATSLGIKIRKQELLMNELRNSY